MVKNDLDLVHLYLRTSNNLVREYILLEILGKMRTSLENLSTQINDMLVQNL